MKTIIPLLFVLFIIISCQKNGLQEPKNDTDQFINTKIEAWKKELVLNGEVGNPCHENVDSWSAENPERFYGLPKEAITVKKFDANNDKIVDYLLFFQAGDCCSCSIGMNEGSDFVKLIYSNKNDFLQNDKLRQKIASKIETEYFNQTQNDVEHAIYSISDFNSNILGTYKLWTLEDPDCCASVKGSFKYNPFTFKIEIIIDKI